MINMENSVCFIGHRKIKDTPELRNRLRSILSVLIEGGTVNYIFGDHSAFDGLCYELITELKKTHPDIRRIQFRRNYADADEYTMKFLLSGFEESICPREVEKAGRASYVKRNQAMIQESDICVFYYDERYLPPASSSKSGTAIAFQYAKKKNKMILNCFEAESDSTSIT